MKIQNSKKSVNPETNFFEKFGVGEHLGHPSFALDDEDFEGVH